MLFSCKSSNFVKANSQRSSEIRKLEVSEFRATSTDLVESIDAVTRALQVVENAHKSSKLDDDAFLQILTPKARASFLQMRDPVQSNKVQYESKRSSAAADMLQNLKDKFTDEHRTVSQEDREEQAAHDLRMQAFTGELKNSKAQKDRCSKKAAEHASVAAAATGDAKQQRSEKSEDEETLRSTEANCNNKAKGLR